MVGCEFGFRDSSAGVGSCDLVDNVKVCTPPVSGPLSSMVFLVSACRLYCCKLTCSHMGPGIVLSSGVRGKSHDVTSIK